MLYCRWIVLAALLLGHMLVPTATLHATSGETMCFERETGWCISGRFLDYWRAHGGLPVFGYPITPARNEANRENGATYVTQWFERARFELHPGVAAPYDVQLGRLGADGLQQHGIDWRLQPGANGPPPTNCRTFGSDGLSIFVCDQATRQGFLSYWRNHGLDLGDPGISERESLALFGLPLTMAQMERNADGEMYLTQWFERARFEWHPEKPDEYQVLLGLLGREIYAPLQESVVDELDPRFGIDGAWQRDTATGYNGHTYWACVNGDTVNTQGNWRPQLPVAGVYEVFAFVPDYHSNTTNARYEIEHVAGRSVVGLAQQPYANQWMSLGTYQFDAGVGGSVRLTNATGEPPSCRTQVAFDAVKWVLR